MTISAKIICDSISESGKRLTTLQLKYPRFIHSEFMTHRAISKNASSSRAIPVKKMIEEIQRDTAMPIYWGKNQPGMQAKEECNEPVIIDFQDLGEVPLKREDVWLEARDSAIEFAKAFAEAGYHKQIVNRLLEPFMHINVLCTATEFSNFFALRIHEDAQPEIHELAKVMKETIDNSNPILVKMGEWHLPYINENERKLELTSTLTKISVARCCRVSYLTNEMKVSTVEEDVKLYDKLYNSGHMSPFEHIATPDRMKVWNKWTKPEFHGNFVGWQQLRKMMPGECR